MAKWLINAGVDEIGEAFVAGCSGNQIDLVKWLFEYSKHDLTISFTDAFEESCKRGHLAVAKWLYSTGYVDFTKSDIRYDILGDVCENSHLPVAEWLITLPEVNISHRYEIEGYETGSNIFVVMCENGWLDLAKNMHNYLIENKVEIDYHVAFYGAFRSGRIGILDWLYSILEIDLNDILQPNDLIFERSPDDGKLDSFKWLISVAEFPDDHIDTYLPFELAEDAFSLGYRPVSRLMKLYEDYSQRKQLVINETEGHELFGYRYLIKLICDY